MPRIKKKNTDITAAIEKYGKINGVQIVGHIQTTHMGEEPQHEFVLEDGKAIFEDHKGKQINQIEKTPPHKRKK